MGNAAGSTGSSIPTYGFAGREPDASGLVYMRARYQHPAYGRFISRDPMGLTSGISPYQYADGNPISFNDPTGLIARSVSNTVTNYAGQAQNYFNQPYVRDTFNTIGTGAKAAVGNIFADTINSAASWTEKFTHSTSGSFGRVDTPVTITNPFQQQVANDLRGVAGTALSFAPILSGVARGAAQESSYLYRGVSAGHPAIDSASQGRVIPGNVNGTISAEAHNLGGQAANSPFTSWTRDPAIAATHAGKNGPGGVVLRVPQGAPSAGAKWSWEWSPDVWGESEVLMRGTRSGLEVLK